MTDKNRQKSWSPSKEDGRRSAESKRGMFTSLIEQQNEQKPHANAYLQSSLPGLK